MYPRTRQNNKRVQDFYKQPNESAQLIIPKLGVVSTEQKNTTRKKDKVISKRKQKQQPLKQLAQKTTAENSSSQHTAQLKSQQSANSSTVPDKDLEPSNYCEQQLLKEQHQLQKIVRKPNYIKIQENSIVKGYTGHSSVIFKRPILQGQYYFELKILKPLENQSNLSFPPSVRVGLCPYDYPHTIPLGGKGSLCYRSIDGNLIENKKSAKFGPSFSEGDLIGVELKIGPPHKHPVKEDKNEGSRVTFYKNREKVGKYEDLKQIFYTVGISLFNYAAVEVRIHQNNIQYLPEGFEPYIQNLNKEIPYKDLKSSRIFNE